MQLLDEVVYNTLSVRIFAQYVGDQSSVLHRPEDTQIPISYLPMWNLCLRLYDGWRRENTSYYASVQNVPTGQEKTQRT